MRKYLGLIILFFSVARCTAQDNKPDREDFFNADNFTGDTLYIKSRFMECGEWGGHLELSKMYSRDKDFFINYQMFEADCHSVNDKNLTPNQKLVKTITKKLLDKDKSLINLYIHQLLAAKFIEPVPMNSGYMFEVKKSDNSLLINVYTWGATTKDQYLRFIKTLLE